MYPYVPDHNLTERGWNVTKTNITNRAFGYDLKRPLTIDIYCDILDLTCYQSV